MCALLSLLANSQPELLPRTLITEPGLFMNTSHVVQSSHPRGFSRLASSKDCTYAYIGLTREKPLRASVLNASRRHSRIVQPNLLLMRPSMCARTTFSKWHFCGKTNDY